MIDLNIVQEIAVAALPLLLAITLHEVAHGRVAYALGDPTAKVLGRLTLNPLKHIDLLGTVIVPIAILLLSKFQFVFGWAKPVPVTWQNLKSPHRDMALVAIAGPLANLLMALSWASLLWCLHPVDVNNPVALYFSLASQTGILVNIVLMVLNLIPIPPLDGSRVLASMLPRSLSSLYSRIEPFGLIIIMALIFTRLLHPIIIEPTIIILNFIYKAFGI